MTLAEWDIPNRRTGPSPRNAANDALYWVELRPDGARLCRCDGARLVLDLKAAVGMSTTSNTAFGPETVDRVRTAWLTGGVPPGDLPKAKTEWRAGERVPEWLVRRMIWWTYARPIGLTEAQVVYDGQPDAEAIRYGTALGTGTQAAHSVVCEPVSRRERVERTGSSSSNSGGSSSSNSGGSSSSNSGGSSSSNSGGSSSSNSGGSSSSNSGGSSSSNSNGDSSNNNGSSGDGATRPMWQRIVAWGTATAAVVGATATAVWWASTPPATTFRQPDDRPALPPPPPLEEPTSRPPARPRGSRARPPTDGEDAAYSGMRKRIRRVDS